MADPSTTAMWPSRQIVCAQHQQQEQQKADDDVLQVFKCAAQKRVDLRVRNTCARALVAVWVPASFVNRGDVGLHRMPFSATRLPRTKKLLRIFRIHANPGPEPNCPRRAVAEHENRSDRRSATHRRPRNASVTNPGGAKTNRRFIKCVATVCPDQTGCAMHRPGAPNTRGVLQFLRDPGLLK